MAIKWFNSMGTNSRLRLKPKIRKRMWKRKQKNEANFSLWIPVLQHAETMLICTNVQLKSTKMEKRKVLLLAINVVMAIKGQNQFLLLLNSKIPWITYLQFWNMQSRPPTYPLLTLAKEFFHCIMGKFAYLLPVSATYLLLST